jgi:hypothetical protein
MFVVSFDLPQNHRLVRIVSDDSSCHVVLVDLFKRGIVFESTRVRLDETEGRVSRQVNQIILYYHFCLYDFLTLVIFRFASAILLVNHFLVKF